MRLPRALKGGAQKECTRDDFNQVFVRGTLERTPYSRTTESGLSWLSFSVKLSEGRDDGHVFTTYIPIEADGSAAEEARDLSIRDMVVISGKLKFSLWTAKDGTKKSSLAVLARQMRLGQPAAVLA